MNNQFPIKNKANRDYYLFWIHGKIKQTIAGPLPIPILQFKKKQCKLTGSYSKGQLLIRTKEGITYA